MDVPLFLFHPYILQHLNNFQLFHWFLLCSHEPHPFLLPRAGAPPFYEMWNVGVGSVTEAEMEEVGVGSVTVEEGVGSVTEPRLG